MEFGALPPEVNSARIYSGPGPAPMLAAATAWDVLAVELSCAATAYGSIVAELIGGGWLGPASLSMAAATAPYVSWLHSTAARAGQTAVQANEAAAAYEMAFAMTVPPPVIAANRSLLMALVATNFFGQNGPAIAATEAHYAEMWAQDAAAMYGYAGSSAAAAQLTPFNSPQPNTDPAGTVAQAGAVAHAAASASDPPSLMSAYSVGLSVPKMVNTAMSASNAANTGRSIAIQNARLAFQEARDAESTAQFGGRLVATAPARISGSAVSAAMGRSALVGSLSVPPAWASAAPEARPVSLTLTSSGANTAAVGSAPPPVPGSAFSQSVLGTLSRYGFDGPRAKSKPVIVRSPAAG
ncbi:PPE family protein [Mycobacterium kyorinense]|uniref:PPE family protein n=1 Tax=Mycobacterium kyorinense TaxID=487514 RepID=UPI0009ECDA12